MRKLLLPLALWLGLAAPALAVDPYTSVGNTNYSIQATDTRLVPTAALTANRTWTLPNAAASCIGQTCGATALDIVDLFGNVGGANSCIILAPASGENLTVNGAPSTSSLTFCGTGGRLSLQPYASGWQVMVVAAGQTLGTTTNDNAAAGNVGELQTTGLCPGSATTATVTITIAAPGVITWTGHGFTAACPVVFTNSGGALPTGITSGTTYYVVPSSITTNTFTIATTVANALAGTAVTTSGSQSGTQTGTAGVSLSTTVAATVTGLALPAGDWDCRAMASRTLGASTSVTLLKASINSAATTIASQGLNASSYLSTAANVMGAAGEDQDLGPTRISLAATTNEFLVVQDTFTVSTDVGFGSLTCRRVR